MARAEGERFTTMEESSNDNRVILRGWLFKLKRSQSRFLPSWNRRWFTLKDGELFWHRSQRSATASGSILLQDVTSIQISGHSEGKQCFGFIVRSKTRCMYLRAPSAGKLEYWTSALRMHVNLEQGGTSYGQACRNIQRKCSPSEPRHQKITRELLEILDSLEDAVTRESQTPSRSSRERTLSSSDSEESQDGRWDVLDASPSASSSSVGTSPIIQFESPAHSPYHSSKSTPYSARDPRRHAEPVHDLVIEGMNESPFSSTTESPQNHGHIGLVHIQIEERGSSVSGQHRQSATRTQPAWE